MKLIREMMTKVVNYMVEAESEVPEKMRASSCTCTTFTTSSTSTTKEASKSLATSWLKWSAVTNRYRQLLEAMHTDGGTFEKGPSGNGG